MTCYGGSGARISTCCTRTRWAMVFFGSIFSFPLSASSICLSYGFSLFFSLLSLLSPPFPTNTDNRSTRAPLFSSVFFFPRRRYHPTSFFCAPPFFFFFYPFFLFFRRYVLSSHIRIVISPCCSRWGPCNGGAAAGRTMLRASV